VKWAEQKRRFCEWGLELKLFFLIDQHASTGCLRPNIALTPLVQLDLLERLKSATFSGPQWGHECDDLDLTLLSWQAGQRIEAHVNEEVDVVWIGLEGTGVALVDGERHELRPGVLLLVPKGVARGVEAVSERFSYLSVHKRRRGLMPTFAAKSVA
jgi:mannose-6-phosphate isomerase-like protein (cupin superfamily)